MSIVSRLRNLVIILLGYFENKKTEAQRHKVTWSSCTVPKAEVELGLCHLSSALLCLGLGWGEETWEQEDLKSLIVNLSQMKKTAVN